MVMDYALFLRGVNVGGIKVESARLRQVLTDLGLGEVTTYLASGNVTLATDVSAADLQAMVERALTEAFAYDAHVLVYERAALATIVAEYPYGDDADHHRYAVFCDSAATAVALGDQAGDEPVTVAGTVVYWQCPKGSSLDTPFAKVLAKRAYKAVTTTRTLNTVERMVDLSGP